MLHKFSPVNYGHIADLEWLMANWYWGPYPQAEIDNVDKPPSVAPFASITHPSRPLSLGIWSIWNYHIEDWGHKTDLVREIRHTGDIPYLKDK